jgi:hypothetical protein
MNNFTHVDVGFVFKPLQPMPFIEIPNQFKLQIETCGEQQPLSDEQLLRKLRRQKIGRTIPPSLASLLHSGPHLATLVRNLCSGIVFPAENIQHGGCCLRTSGRSVIWMPP